MIKISFFLRRFFVVRVYFYRKKKEERKRPRFLLYHKKEGLCGFPQTNTDQNCCNIDHVLLIGDDVLGVAVLIQVHSLG